MNRNNQLTDDTIYVTWTNVTYMYTQEGAV